MRYGNLKWHVDTAQECIDKQDHQGAIEAANKMERAGYYKEAWRTFHRVFLSKERSPLKIWRGPKDPCRTLLIQPRIRDLGDELRLAHLCERAAQDVGQIIVKTEERLIPLFQRSFPNCFFIGSNENHPAGDHSRTTCYEQLAFFYARTPEEIKPLFKQLRPKPTPDNQKPRGIGIAWYSSAMYKNLPNLEDWAHILKAQTGRVQSLQYREGRAGLEELSTAAARPIKASRGVDQFKDLDGYAAQVGSVKGVLTISNTTAHLAGALGIPCVVILDDGPVTTWPDHENTSPFYPSLRLVRRHHRDWRECLEERIKILNKAKR